MAKRAAKAEKVQTPRGEANAVIPLTPTFSPYSINVQYGRSEGIVRGDGADWFGPLNPMAPIAPPDVAGRRFDYIPGYNLTPQPRSYDLVGFPMMRALADSYDLLRLVIETRKDQICRMRWKVRVKADEVGGDNPGKGIKATTDQQNRIDAIEDFFERPDGVNRWRPWLRSLLEDIFVLDAPALYCQRNRGGKLIALKQVDGATVKVLIDDWGRTPQPYMKDGKIIVPPAFQQSLKGLPALDYSTKDLVYKPYNQRAHKAYGYSPVEQIIVTVNIAMRRQMFQLSYYTEGNVPEALIGTPDQWTPEQIIAFQNRWDTMLAGNLAQRRHALFVPGGVAKTFIATKAEALMDKMDEWLARIVCFAFSIAPTPFIQQNNRATANTAQEVAKEEGVETLKEYLKDIIDDVLEKEFDAEDLEFAWNEEVEVDQTAQTNLVSKRVEDGLITINQAREAIGEEQSDDPAADVLMVKTATGFVPIDANTAAGKKAAIDAGLVPDPTIPKVVAPPPGAGGEGGEGGPGASSPPAKKKPNEPPAKGAERPKTSETKGGGGKPQKFHAHGTARFRKAAGRRLPPVPFDRPASVKAERRVKKLIAGALAKIAKGVAKQVRKSDIGKVAKASNSDEANRIAREADLSAFDAVVADVGYELAKAAADSAEAVLAQLGIDAPEELMNQVNDAAVAMAQDLGAELVGQRYNEDGELVPAVRAEYRIDQSTRDMIAETISDGLDENLGTDAIAAMIEDSTGFSADRAELIAHTEIRRANSAAALEGYKGAADAGVTVQKEWLLGADPCPICEDNADDGPIDLDDDFSSGDDAPPAHPNCECALAPVVVDEAREE